MSPGYTKRNHLARGVNASIGSPSPLNTYGRLGDLLQASLYVTLNGSPFGLNLKTLKFSSIIFDNSTIALLLGHWPPLAKLFLFLIHQLNQGHFGRISSTRSKLIDTGITTVAAFKTGSDLVKKLLQYFWVVNILSRLTTSV
jgi:hypothetical protein